MKPYPKNEIERLNQIPIIQVAQKLGLKVSERHKVIKCFLHNDKTASLNFDIKKNRWKCFGCDKGGGVINLVQKFYKIDFRQAVAWLGGSGVKYEPVIMPIAQSQLNPNPIIYADFLSLCIDHDSVKSFFCEKKKIKEDVFNASMIKMLGDSTIIKQKLISKWGEKALLDCGLLVKRKNQDREFLGLQWYKNDTIIIPFINELSQITYLKGRNLTGDIKHLNIEGLTTDLYNRNILSSLKVGDKLYICEGETDTLSALSMGLNAIGILGAHSFKSEYVDLLKDYKVYLIPDDDNAGKQMIEKVRNEFFKINKSVEIVYLNNGDDLNSYYARNNY